MEIKSQHELTTAGSRQSDVLIEALKKCQELEAEMKTLLEETIKEYEAEGKEAKFLKELLAKY